MSSSANHRVFASEKYSAELAFALTLADRADSISLSRYHALDLVITTKPDNTPVTDADKAVERAIIDAIAVQYPTDGVVGEEFGTSGSKDRYWIIDPIDGTKNFLRGVPTWATLIALVENEKVVVSVVSSPALYRRWYATKDGGAYVLDSHSPSRKLSVSKVAAISDASIAYSDFQGWGARRSAFEKLLDSTWRSRGMGDFWSHMLVAEGAVDVAIEPSLALWDMAALDLIVREAGGRFSSLDGVDGPFGPNAISSNGALHEVILEAINGER
ncbi:MAG: inositol monophosphatase family protein [Candidatus Planktophila sp.]